MIDGPIEQRNDVFMGRAWIIVEADQPPPGSKKLLCPNSACGWEVVSQEPSKPPFHSTSDVEAWTAGYQGKRSHKAMAIAVLKAARNPVISV
jgi:hypothetical protein